MKHADDEIIHEESKSSMESSRIVTSPSTIVITNVTTRVTTLNPTLGLTMNFSTIHPFVDIADKTIAVPSTKVVDDTTRGKNYQQSFLPKKCKKGTKCATEDCKGGKKKNVIDVFGDELFPI